MANLYIVSTPIGNLKDITLRAIETLNNCSIWVVEDTRQAQKLISGLNLKRPERFLVLNNFQEKKQSAKIMSFLEQGHDLALVSDSGTPLLSDPGFDLVRRAIAVNITPIAIPGPSALLTALCTAGIPLNRFIFAGFLSKKPGKRRKELGQLLQFPGAIILYESPYRIVKLLNDLAVLNNELELAICRELTKKFEEIIRGKVTTVLQNLNERKQIKGEFVVIIDNKSNN